MAVAHFSKKNYEQFLYHINDLKQHDDIKEFWVSLYYLRQDDFDNFQVHYANIKVSEETLINRTFLESVRLYTQGECDLAGTKMLELYKDLKQPILKQIADEVLKFQN